MALNVTLTETYTFIPVREDSKVVARDTTCVTSIHTIPLHEREQSVCYFSDVQGSKRYINRTTFIPVCEDSKVIATDTTACVTLIHTIEPLQLSTGEVFTLWSCKMLIRFPHIFIPCWERTIRMFCDLH